MKVYKVVRRTPDNRLYSGFVVGSWSIIYVPGERIEAPRGTRLFCFQRLKEAGRFARYVCNAQVYLAEAEGVEEPPDKIPGCFYWEWRHFWEGKPVRSSHLTAPPPGTILCRAIILKEKVQ